MRTPGVSRARLVWIAVNLPLACSVAAAFGGDPACDVPLVPDCPCPCVDLDPDATSEIYWCRRCAGLDCDGWLPGETKDYYCTYRDTKQIDCPELEIYDYRCAENSNWRDYHGCCETWHAMPPPCANWSYRCTDND